MMRLGASANDLAGQDDGLGSCKVGNVVKDGLGIGVGRGCGPIVGRLPGQARLDLVGGV